MSSNDSSDRNEQRKWQGPAAVIFTHCHGLEFKNYAQFAGQRKFYLEKYTQQIESYLQCNRDNYLISVVYQYVDAGLKYALREKQKSDYQPESEAFSSKALSSRALLEALLIEPPLRQILEQAAENARRNLNLSADVPPKFCFIGLNELLRLLTYLDDVDPDLVKFVAGPKGEFTYDSPKFVEAVIRLARGDIPSLAQSPIIRVDDDAKVNPESIRQLIDTFTQVSKDNPFYFFSGRYRHSKDTDEHYDVINDYAVRTHWFFPAGTKPEDARFYSESSDSKFQDQIKLAEQFLTDLSVLGANQPAPIRGNRSYSKELTKIIEEGKLISERQLEEEQRRAPQVISGAGLIMGRRNVELLPPFMNFGGKVTWVDDHLKRRLHERLEDMTYVDKECLEDIIFEQNRHPAPAGTQDKDTRDQSWYLERLLEGCLFHAMIMDSEDDQYCYSDLIRDIVWFKKVKSDITNQLKDLMKAKLTKVVIKRYELVLKCWSSYEFEGYASHSWAKEKLDGFQPGGTPLLCEKVIEDAMNYIELLLDWHKFTRAIERLKFLDNGWLFDQGFV